MRPRMFLTSALLPLTCSLVLMETTPTSAQTYKPCNCIYFGPPPNPSSYDRFPTVAGYMAFAGYDEHVYSGISLRQALDQYGWFGRRYRQQTGDARCAAVTPGAPNATEGTQPAAVLRVLLPPDAELWIADRPTSLRGAERQFVTSPLAAGGSYSDEIRARWFENGREVARRQTVTLYPGDRRTLDFRTPADEPVLLNRPRKLGD
jgi:uncharacterized protein (TIGR03000 family)